MNEWIFLLSHKFKIIKVFGFSVFDVSCNALEVCASVLYLWVCVCLSLRLKNERVFDVVLLCRLCEHCVTVCVLSLSDGDKCCHTQTNTIKHTHTHTHVEVLWSQQTESHHKHWSDSHLVFFSLISRVMLNSILSWYIRSKLCFRLNEILVTHDDLCWTRMSSCLTRNSLVSFVLISCRSGFVYGMFCGLFTQ